MLDLGIGPYLEMIERRWGRFWSGLLMLVIYLTVLALCLPLIWNRLIVPGYGVGLKAWDYGAQAADWFRQPGALSRMMSLLRTPTIGWHEVFRQFVGAIFLFVFMMVGLAAIAIVWTLTLVMLAKLRGKPLDYYVKAFRVAD